MASAATQRTQQAPPSADRSDNDRRMFGLLREIRAACQYLQKFLAEVSKRIAVMDARGRAAYLRRELSPALRDRVDGKITIPIRAIERMFDSDVTEFEWCADNVASIELTWSHIKDLWPVTDEAFEDFDARFKQITDELDEIVYQCESLSLSPRVNDTMNNLRVGQPLDVEFEFGDEFPNAPELRHRLMLELAQESAVVECGVIDVADGVIYKAASSRREQKKSLWRILGWIVGGLLIPVALVLGEQFLTGWPLKSTDLARLAADYVLIMVGAGAHLAIDSLKAAKAQTRPSFQALNDAVLWVHVRENEVRLGIFYVWMGYVLLAFGIPGFDWTSAFFAGYSIDSVTELYLGRFQSKVKAATELLTRTAK